MKRKSKAVLVKDQKKENADTKGKPRIDCWHRDKDTNVVIYGNRQQPGQRKKSLTKAKPQLRQEYQPMVQPVVQMPPAQVKDNTIAEISQIAHKQYLDDTEEDLIPDENEFQTRRTDMESPGATQNNLNFLQIDMGEMGGNNDQPKQSIDELEAQFQYLHGPDYFLRDEYNPE